MIVKLCTEATLFIRKPFFSQLSSSIWKPFDTEFGAFVTDLGSRAATIRDEVSLASERAQKDEREANAIFRAFASRSYNWEIQKKRERKNEKARFRLLDACSMYDHQIAYKQAKKHGITRWIFEHDVYKQWRQEQRHSGILWCTGILGSGKTVLSANVVEDILSIPTATVAYFFCKHDEAESLKARTIVGSIARQFFSCLKLDLVDRLAQETLSFLDTDQILGYIEQLLPSDQVYFIMLDGLDECEESEAMTVTKCLKQMIAFKQVFHIYFSSRPDLFSWVPSLLQPQWKISMQEADTEIAEYINFELEQRLESGALRLTDPTIIISIQDRLLKGAQGMCVRTMPLDVTAANNS